MLISFQTDGHKNKRQTGRERIESFGDRNTDIEDDSKCKKRNSQIQMPNNAELKE